MAVPGAIMSAEDNKAIVTASFEAIFNQHQVDRAAEFYAPDYLDHAAAPGRPDWRGLSRSGRRPSPPFRTCAPRSWIWSQRQPSTALTEGKITEASEEFDKLNLMQQLGDVPASTAPAPATG